MALVCIAREEGIDADRIGANLAQKIGFEFFDKTKLEQIMLELGLKPEALKKYDEIKPGFWASLSQERDDYLHYLEYALYKTASLKDAVILGRGANVIFANCPGTITLKLVAPLTWRLQMIKNKFQGDEKKALQYIKQTDENRKGFTRYFFNIDWSDPASYSLTLNVAQVTEQSCFEIIKPLVKNITNQETAHNFTSYITSKYKAVQIVDTVIYKHGIPINFFEAEVEGDKAILHGVSSVEPTIEQAVELAKTIPGITTVENSIQLIQDYTIMP